MTPPYIESIGSAENIALLGSNTGIRNNIVGINSVVRASGDEFTQNI